MNINKVLSTYLSLSPITYIFGRLRFVIAPVEEIIKPLPEHGKLLDIGCGYGFISNAISYTRPSLKIYGIDISKSRINLAKKSVGKRNNISFSVRDIVKDSLPSQKFDVILCSDLLHHLPKNFHEELIFQTFSFLNKKGILIIKDIDTFPFYKYIWNFVHDMFVNKGQPIHCRSHLSWIRLLKKNNFKIKSLTFPTKGLLYPHFITVAQK